MANEYEYPAESASRAATIPTTAPAPRPGMDYAGAVEARTARSTGRLVVLLDARNGGEWIDADGDRWITFCDYHSSFVTHETRATARSFMAEPESWCESCAADLADAPDEEEAPICGAVASERTYGRTFADPVCRREPGHSGSCVGLHRDGTRTGFVATGGPAWIAPTVPETESVRVEALRVGDRVVGSLRTMIVAEVRTSDAWRVVIVVLAHPEDESIRTERTFVVGTTVEVVK